MEGADATRNDLADTNEEGGPKNYNNETKRVIKSFEQRIDDLRAYKEKHWHVNVKQSDDKSLFGFCNNIRWARDNPETYNVALSIFARKNPGKPTLALTDERIASLEALGFEWNANPNIKLCAQELWAQKSFERRMEQLRLYKEKQGHVNVKQSEDKSLYQFCNTIRRARKNPNKSKMIINDDRIASLSALGFEWTPEAQRIEDLKRFAQRMDDLRAYKERHGHVNVKGSEDKSLYTFCQHMRHARNYPGKSNTLINEERIASLDALGFEWKNRFSDPKSFQ